MNGTRLTFRNKHYHDIVTGEFLALFQSQKSCRNIGILQSMTDLESVKMFIIEKRLS